MKVVILYRPNSDQARKVEEFVADYKRNHGTRGLEVLDVDSREGSAMASLYDIMSFPTILALADDGGVQNSWQGEMLPLMDELAYYTNSDDTFASKADASL
jgi:hypothetical protein